MLWNEWHACANSRRPDISKVSDRAVYTALFPLQIRRFLPWQGPKDPGSGGEDRVGVGWEEWGNKNEHGDRVCFYIFQFSMQTAVAVRRLLVLRELALFF